MKDTRCLPSWSSQTRGRNRYLARLLQRNRVESESTEEGNCHSTGERGIQEDFGELTFELILKIKCSPEREEEGHQKWKGQTVQRFGDVLENIQETSKPLFRLQPRSLGAGRGDSRKKKTEMQRVSYLPGKSLWTMLRSSDLLLQERVSFQAAWGHNQTWVQESQVQEART